MANTVATMRDFLASHSVRLTILIGGVLSVHHHLLRVPVPPVGQLREEAVIGWLHHGHARFLHQVLRESTTLNVMESSAKW